MLTKLGDVKLGKFILTRTKRIMRALRKTSASEDIATEKRSGSVPGVAEIAGICNGRAE